MYVPFDTFVANLKQGEPVLRDNPHLVDETSIAQWLNLKLRNFGRNVMAQHETMVHIDNFRGELPLHFASLVLAVYCEVDQVSYPEGTNPGLVQTRLYAEKISCTETQLCEECSYTCDEDEPITRVVEGIYIDQDIPVQIQYTNFQYVKIGRDLIRSHCAADCINRNVKDSPYSINIKGNTVYANFKSGSLYVRYYAHPRDEEGMPMIPETMNGWLEEYLYTYVLRRIIRQGSLSKDLRDQFTMYGDLRQEELDLYNKAKADTSAITMQQMFKAVGRNRERMGRYNIHLGAIQSNYSESILGFGPWSPLDTNPFNF